MKKTVGICGMLLVLVLLLAPAALAAEEREIPIYYNGFQMDLERPALAGDGVTLVPAEEFCQKLGGIVASSPLDGTPFPEHVQARWAEDGSNTLTAAAGEHTVTLPAELLDGRAYVPLRPLAEGLGLTVDWDGAVRLSSPKKRVEVDSLEGLFHAVDSHTEIVLADGTYSFGDLDPGQINNPHVLVYAGVDGRDDAPEGVYELAIYGVCDLTFSANGAVLSTPWAYADVLKLEDCRRITLQGAATLLHDVEPGFCSGDCLSLTGCEDVSVWDYVLDGSGAYGLSVSDSRDILLEQATLSHCTYGAVSLSGSSGVTLRDCVIEDMECFHLLSAMGAENILFDRCVIRSNAFGSLVECYQDSRDILFRACTFSANRLGGAFSYGWQASGGAVFENCTLLDSPSA